MAVQIGGLASGMQTETIIKSILEGEQAQINTYERQLKDDKTKLEGWNEVSTQISKLKNATSPLSNFETWDQKKAVSTVNIMTVTANEKSLDTDYNIKIDNLATKTCAKTNTYTDDNAQLNLAGTFTIEGKDITIVAEDSLKDIANKINQSQGTTNNDEKVIAQVIGGTLVFEKVNTGSRNISLSESGSNNVLRQLGILDNVDSGGGNYSTIKTDHISMGKDLKGSISGIDFTRKNNTAIDDLIPGVTINFTGTGSTKLTISNDTDALKKLITDFINTYNKVIDEVGKLTQYVLDGENKTTTDEDGKEIKAETGTLQGESLANGYVSRLRSTLMGSIDKNNNLDLPIETLNDMGIWFKDKEGHLEIANESKLYSALKNNFQNVEDFFRGYSDAETNQGLMRTVENINQNYNDLANGSVTVRKNMLTKEIQRKEKQITQMYDDLKDYESKLWKQFSNMETNVAKINNSMKYLINSLGLEDDNDD